MKEIKICLAWHDFNSTNFGVGALAISHLHIIYELAKENNVNLIVDTIGFPDGKGIKVRSMLEKRLNLKLEHTSLSLKSMLKDILKFKFGKDFYAKNYKFVLDIGAGDSFADIYGFRRFVFMIATKQLGVKNGCKLILSPQTIGTFIYKIYEKIAKHYMGKAQSVFVRDHKSHQYLNHIGVNCLEVSDVAFALPYDKSDTRELSVGINISGLLWNGGYTKNNQFGLNFDYKDFVIKQIEGFLKRDQDVHLVSHVIDDFNEIEDDYNATKIAKSFFLDNERVIIAPKFQSPIEAKSYISTMTFFTGSRMHATIGAVSSGVPTIPIAYSRKFSGVFESIGYKYTLDAFSGKTQNELLENIFSEFDRNINQIKKDAEEASKTALNKLDLYKIEIKKILL